MTKEIIVLIHGVNPRSEGSNAVKDYDTLREGVQSELNAKDSLRAKHWRAATPCTPTWGWMRDHNAQARAAHELLQRAQLEAGNQLFTSIDDQSDITWNPLRIVINQLRPVTFYGFGDMFYYCSADGKNGVRQEVGSEIQSCISPDDEALSITLIGHSAGAVIAADLAFYIFNQKGVSKFVNPQHVVKPANKSSLFSSKAVAQTNNWIRKLRRKVGTGRLRLRRLITLGSPFSLVLFRSDAIIRTLADRGAKLDPLDYGLESQFADEVLPRGPRWINVWDKDDVISWPLSFLFGRDDLVVDLHPDVSDQLSKVHGAFWTSRKVHELIAERW